MTRPPKRKRVAEGVYRVERKDGARYQLSIYVPPAKDQPAKRKWHTLPKGTTLPQAKARKRELEAAKHQPKRGKTETVQEFFDGWEKRFPHRKESTVRWQHERVSVFVREFGHVPLNEITRAEARDWALDHQSNLPAVRAFFGHAKDLGFVAENPFAKLGLKQSKGRQNIRVLTDDELNALVQASKRVHGEYGEHFADLIVTAAWTGLRPGELFALIPERVDLKAGLIHVEESAENRSGRIWSLKTTHSDRQVVLLGPAERALRRTMEVRGPEEFLFQTKMSRSRAYADGRAAFRGVTFGNYWHPVREVFTASLPESHWLPRRIKAEGDKGRLHLYELRHRFGTALGQAGALPQEIADQMGHKDGGKLAMQVYCHFDRDHVQNRIRSLFAA